MGSINQERGTLVRLYPDATNPIGGEMTSAITLTVEELDANTKDNANFHEWVPGRISGDITASGKLDTGDTGFGVLQTRILSPWTAMTWEWKTFDATRQYSGSAWIQNLGYTADQSGLIEWSCGIKPSGTITEEASA